MGAGHGGVAPVAPGAAAQVDPGGEGHARPQRVRARHPHPPHPHPDDGVLPESGRGRRRDPAVADGDARAKRAQRAAAHSPAARHL